MKELAFLFGSGISLKAGLPGCREITTRVMAAEEAYRHTDGHYHIGSHPNPGIDPSWAFLERIRLLLQLLKTEADLYYFGDRIANYEDIYYIAYQVWASLAGEIDNPGMGILIRTLDDRLKKVMREDPNQFKNVMKSSVNWYQHEVSNLLGLARECCSYIQDYVVGMLSTGFADLAYLSWVADAVRDPHFDQKVIFTLNYDLLLEQFMFQQKLPISDGFSHSVDTRGIRI